MSWFDDLLNFLIPIVLYVILGFWLWRMFSPMFKDIGGGEGG